MNETFWYIFGLVLGLIFLFVILVVATSGPKPPIAKLNHTELDYVAAIHKFNLTPSIIAECYKIDNSTSFIILRWDGNCSAWNLGTLNYMIDCVEITEKGWVDHCGVLSSEARKKLSASNNTSG